VRDDYRLGMTRNPSAAAGLARCDVASRNDLVRRVLLSCCLSLHARFRVYMSIETLQNPCTKSLHETGTTQSSFSQSFTMSCWRVLQLSDQPNAEQIPQLLIKPRFDTDAYTVFLTDLSNIWSEELELAGIVDRALEEESPIEVSKKDTGQLAILLENVRNSLASNDDTSCLMTRDTKDGVTLHTTIRLPEPLDSLRWTFRLRKRTAVTLKDELILPLLVSSHIQHDRLNGLISTIADKDRAITRLVDQYESSNLDLTAAFPSIGSLKSGRRVVKREQAARHVPGLQAFDQDSWKRNTAELQDTDVSTLGLFQAALLEYNPKVPRQLLSEDESNVWWTTIKTAVEMPKSSSKAKPKAMPNPPPKPVTADSETEEEETDDEFEVHENFKVCLLVPGCNVLSAHP